QEVLLKLSRRMRTFQYDPAKNFRAYLKTLARYAWCDLLTEREKPGAEGGGSIARQQIESEAARDDLARRFEENHDRELLQDAMGAVQSRVEPHTWEAFRLTALEGLSGAETASRLGMSIASVFKARSRVQRMLRDAVADADEHH